MHEPAVDVHHQVAVLLVELLQHFIQLAQSSSRTQRKYRVFDFVTFADFREPPLSIAADWT